MSDNHCERSIFELPAPEHPQLLLPLLVRTALKVLMIACSLRSSFIIFGGVSTVSRPPVNQNNATSLGDPADHAEVLNAEINGRFCGGVAGG